MSPTRWFRSDTRASASSSTRRRRMRLTVEPLEDRLAPATRTWAGLGLDNVWSNHANWVGSVVPVPNDDLVFPSNAPRLVNVNNLPGYIFNSITFTGANYLITGNILGIRGPGIVQSVAGTNVFELKTFFVGPELRPIAVAAGGTLHLNEELSGPGGFTKTGGGTLVLGGTIGNIYASSTTVQEGTLVLSKTGGGLAIPGELVVGDSVGGTESDVVRLTAPGQIAPVAMTVNGAGLLALNGFALSLPGLTLNGGRVDTGAATLSLSGNLTANAAATSAVLRGTIDLGLAPRTITVADGAATEDLVLVATLTASGAITKAGTGRLVFGAANNFASTVTVSAGTLNVRHGNALGATTAGTVVAAGAALELQGGVAIGAEPLTVTNAGGDGSVLRNLDGQNSWAGAVTILNDVRIAADSGRLDLMGAIQAVGGSWGLTKSGPGTLSFGGVDANTYTGMTAVVDGTLVLAKRARIAAVRGDLRIGDGAFPTRPATVRHESSNQFAASPSVTIVGAGSKLDLNNHDDIIGTLTFTGGQVSTGTGRLEAGDVRVNAADTTATLAGRFFLNEVDRKITVARGSAGEDLLVSGAVTANIVATKAGPGVVRVTGSIRLFTRVGEGGFLRVSAGVLIVDGYLGGTVVLPGAVLSGIGTINSVIMDGGTIAPSQGSHSLRTSSVRPERPSNLRVALNGPDGGVGYGQLTVEFGANLHNLTLDAALGFPSLGGSRYLILNNTNNAPVAGTFTGLPEGARLTVSGRPFTISYRGGDGNDVVLTDASVPTTTVLFGAPIPSRGGPIVPITRVGEPLLLQVNVRPSSGSGLPTGRVTVRESGTTNSQTVTLLEGGRAFTFPGLTLGNHTFIAEYEGDDTFGPSTSESFTQAIAKALPALTVEATPNPARGDQTVQIVAFLGAGPTGTVIFRENAATLGSSPIAANGRAELSLSGLTPGVHVLSAVYEGDNNFEARTETITVTVTPALSPEERFVTQLYMDLLNRSVDPQGLAAWSTALRQGMTRSQIAQAIQASEEARALTVAAQYQRFLRRRPDAAGLTAFVGFLGRGGTVEQMQAILVGSAEYQQTQGGGTDRGWLTAAYRDVFNRAPEDTGRAAHLAGLADGVGRQRIAEIIFASNEHRGNLVRDLYQRYLRRGAESAGLSAFVTELARGARQEQLTGVMVGSGEYFGKV